MKTSLVAAVVGLVAMSAAAQVVVNLNNNKFGCTKSPIYGPEPADPTLSKVGNPDFGIPPGIQTYGGPLLSGGDYRAQLFWASGPQSDDAALTAAAPIAGFRSGSLAGYLTNTAISLPLAPGGSGTFQIRVWDNSSGLFPTWAAAEPAWHDGVIAAAKSARLVVGSLTTINDLCGMQGFNLYYYYYYRPWVITLPASAITAHTATLNGQVNPRFTPTSCWFEWGETMSYGNTTVSLSVGSGGQAAPVSLIVDSFCRSTTYHYRLVATNSAGVAYGQDVAFTTLSSSAVPVVQTGTANGIGVTTATVRGSANPNGSTTVAGFYWGVTTNYDHAITNTPGIGSGCGPVEFSAHVTGLSPNTVYHYCAAAINAFGLVRGSDRTFRTDRGLVMPPSVTTLSPSAVTDSSATLAGSVTPNLSASTGWFEWGASTNYGSRTANVSLGSGGVPVNLTRPIYGLAPYSTYHFRAVASNQVGMIRGSDAAFVTPPGVRNVRASQRPGTKLVDILYDLIAPPGATCSITVSVYTNGTMNYALPAASFSGAGYGSGITSGNNKPIVWNAGVDWNGKSSPNTYFQVRADFGASLPYANSGATTVDTRDNTMTVSGRVRSSTGVPLAGVTVSLAGQTVTTDSEGEYTLPNVDLAAGNTLSAASPGFAKSSQTPPISAGTAVAVLPDVFLPTAAVTNRPIVTDIISHYDGLFIAGVPFHNTYAALVDWNGFTPDHVDFYINDTNSTPIPSVETTEISGWTDIEMSQGFFGSYTRGANKIWAVAVDSLGQRSDPYARSVAVIPPPTGITLSPLEWNPLYGDGWLYDPTSLRFKVQVPPEGLLGGFDMVMPLLSTLGLHLEGEYKLTYALPSGAWELAPDAITFMGRRMQPPYLDWGLWGPHFQASASAAGSASQTSGFSMDQIRVQMSIDGKALIFRVHFTDWLPPGPALNQLLDVFEWTPWDINQVQRLDVYGLFGLAADLTWTCRDQRFSEAILTPSGGVEATYGIDACAASFDAYVKGELAFPIRVTSPRAWKVTGEVSFGIAVWVWQLVDDHWDWVLLSGEIASSGNWESAQRVVLPVVTKDGSPMLLEGVLLKGKRSGLRVMDRNYLPAGPAQFVAMDAQFKSGPSATSPLNQFQKISQAPVQGSVAAVQWRADGPAPGPENDGPQGETNQVDLTLLQNVFPFAAPAMAGRGQELMLLFVTDNGDTNTIQFTDIGWTLWDGTNWSTPAAISANSQAEFQPQVKYDGNGDAIAVWQRVADPNFTNVNVSALASQMEIVWSRWSRTNGAWAEPVALTTNNYLDNAPLLCGPMANGDALLVWTENQANLLRGTNGPGTDIVRWREWNATSQSWSAPQVLVDGLAYRLSQSLAGAGNCAAYAWSQDGDGVITNDTDQEVFYATYTNGAWSSPIQFTPAGVANRNVRLAASATGEMYLFWESDGDLVMDRNFSGTNGLVRMADQTTGFTDYTVTLGPAGNFVLLWQGMSTNGSDAHYSVYDPVSRTWSRDDLLCHDPPMERSLAPVWDDAGNLTVAYSKVQTLYTNKTIEVEGGGQVTLTNVPQRGRTDLVVTKRALVKDLALEPGDFAVGGVNYLPGDALSLQALVRNRGNVAVSNAVVSFYNGDPDAGGTLLTNATIPGWLEAGDTNLVTAGWIVPEPATQRVVFAEVNRAGLASEFNASNNLQSVSISGTDVAVSLLSYRAETNGSVRVLARVQNLGAPGAVASILAIRRDGQSNTPLATVTVPTLAPGQLAQLALDLPPGTQPEGRAAYRLFADDTHANLDVNTNNNTAGFAMSLWLDSDGDGLPDSFEAQYPFLNPYDPTDADLDYDGDGMSNLAEYLAGTSPGDSLSYLRINAITVNGAAGAGISWGSVSNKLYSVQRSSALGGGMQFTNLVEHILSTPPENHYWDPWATNAERFFYRVRVE